MNDARDNGRTVIAVPTAGRQADLRRLLTALGTAYGGQPDVELLVVDNDPRASARPIFVECSAPFGDRSRYVVEPQRGYASVRNAVLANLGDAAAVAMIDDDEVPTAGWLEGLLAAQRRTDADVVVGPVVFDFPADAPTWFERSGVFGFEDDALPESTPMKWCASNNTLVRVAAARRVEGGFDTRFDAMSGEDIDFFFRAHLIGCKIVWTNQAVVREPVPAHRLTRSWLFKRAVRSGNTHALIELQLVGRPTVALSRLLKAAGLFAFGLAGAATAAISRDRALGLRAIYRVGLASGMFLAFRSRTPWAP
jgi:succinoglycan biosynthesis protein ExoM